MAAPRWCVLIGHATIVEEMTLAACSVAVPVQHGDAVVAAFGIVVPSLRRDKARLVSALKVAAHGIGLTLDPFLVVGEIAIRPGSI